MAVLARLAALAASASLLAAAAAATTVTHHFNVSWVRANPDGALERPVIGINGRWPIPRIDVDVGDRLVIHVANHLGNQSTSLHFHGLFMNGSAHMDGPVGVTQCAIPPGASFTYDFTVKQPGTYWYHSHVHAQYPDGLRGPLVVHDPAFPYRDRVDEELVLTLSDWYHDQMRTLIPRFLNKANPTGAEPVPDAALINETQRLAVAVRPAKTYLLRIVNMGAFAAQYFWIEGHKMRIVEVDGVYTHEAEADMLYLSAAQRVSVLVETRPDAAANFPMVASMDTELFDVLPPDLDYNSTGWLVYDDAKPKHAPADVAALDAFDDMTLVPYDDMALLPEPDRALTLDVRMGNLADGANYAFFNNVTYVAPKVPSLYTALSTADRAADPAVYGDFSQPFVLARGQVVQVVLNNLDPGRHPFHLHGHNFQAVHRSAEEAGPFAGLNASAGARFPAVPMRRDTLVVWPNGNIVLRFRADSPGVWLFHCHIEWHVVSGLIATFVEAPADLQRQLPALPADHLDACRRAASPTAGNAAGNTADLLDLAGQNRPPGPLPEGFTTRGVVALASSCLAGVLGTSVVAWYGLAAPVESVPHP